MFMNWMGINYIEAELPRMSNEKLLNNLREGVFILEDDVFEVLFSNKAAQRLDKTLRKDCKATLLDIKKPQFAFVDQ